MFKFMKSKKGFTLVELMIVVVIMAILVAVAVPIYSAVTKNARTKTCKANKREIVSQVNNYLMGSVDGKQHTNAGAFSITSDQNKGTVTGASGSGYEQSTIEGLFQTLPFCPSGNTYKVTITAPDAGTSTDADTTAKVEVEDVTATNALDGEAALHNA